MFSCFWHHLRIVFTSFQLLSYQFIDILVLEYFEHCVAYNQMVDMDIVPYEVIVTAKLNVEYY